MSIAISIAIVFHLLGLLSIVNAITDARTPQGSIAWVIFLISCPYIALPAYWLLGRSRFHGYVSARRSEDEQTQNKLNQVRKQLAPFHSPRAETSASGHAAEKLADLPFLEGNRVQLLIDGADTFNDILNGIDAATSYILFQFFIVHDDDIGRAVKDRLVARAKAGVKVYFLYDEVGSQKLSKRYRSDLSEAGVEVVPFNTRKGVRNRFQLNFRNHRKVVVVDGLSSWIGGHNVGDEYLGRDPKFGHWRDTHIRIEGPAIMPIQLSFAEDWYWATEAPLPDLQWTPTPAEGGDKAALVIPSGPADEFETAALMFHHAINSASKRLWIASPYFVPDDAIVAALQLATLRGVDVRILIPDKPDHLLVYLSAFAYFEQVGRAGVRFFRYANGFLHQKVMLIDDEVATVGTANFDNRSFRLNFEITGIIADEDFAKEIEHMLEDDFAHAREMTQADVENHPFWFKFAIRLARLTAPVQ